MSKRDSGGLGCLVVSAVLFAIWGIVQVEPELPDVPDVPVEQLVAISIAILGAISFFGICFILLKYQKKRKRRNRIEQLNQQVEETAGRIAQCARNNFTAKACSRCYESKVEMVRISPNAKSILLKCRNCGKEQWAKAATENAAKILNDDAHLGGLLVRLGQLYEENVTASIVFPVVEVREDIKRERLPEGIRNEIWRRDGGRCVQCGSQKDLEFDHIIPVSEGGANTARNLQLLCEACNRSKGAKI